MMLIKKGITGIKNSCFVVLSLFIFSLILFRYEYIQAEEIYDTGISETSGELRTEESFVPPLSETSEIDVRPASSPPVKPDMNAEGEESSENRHAKIGYYRKIDFHMKENGRAMDIIDIESKNVLWNYRSKSRRDLTGRVFFSDHYKIENSNYIFILSNQGNRRAVLEIRDIRDGYDYFVDFKDYRIKTLSDMYLMFDSYESLFPRHRIDTVFITQSRQDKSYALQYVTIKEGMGEEKKRTINLQRNIKPIGVFIDVDQIVLLYINERSGKVFVNLFEIDGLNSNSTGTHKEIENIKGAISTPLLFSDENGSGLILVTHHEAETLVYFMDRMVLRSPNPRISQIGRMSGSLGSKLRIFKQMIRNKNFYYLAVVTKDNKNAYLSYYQFNTENGGRFLKELIKGEEVNIGSEETVHMNLVPGINKYYLILGGNKLYIYRYKKIAGTRNWKKKEVAIVDLPYTAWEQPAVHIEEDGFFIFLKLADFRDDLFETYIFPFIKNEPGPLKKLIIND